MRGISLSILFIAALVLNPFFACGNSPSFSFSLADVERALAGTWHAKVTKDGHTTQVSFRIEAGAGPDAQQTGARHLVRPAAACGQRTLVKSAAACLDETFVPLVLVAVDDHRKMKGTLRIIGTSFERGQAMLHLGDTSLTAQISSAGSIEDVKVVGDATAELTHTR